MLNSNPNSTLRTPKSVKKPTSTVQFDCDVQMLCGNCSRVDHCRLENERERARERERERERQRERESARAGGLEVMLPTGC
jgi:hypothetical protein